MLHPISIGKTSMSFLFVLGMQIPGGSDDNYVIKVKKVSDSTIILIANHLDSAHVELKESVANGISIENDSLSFLYDTIGRELVGSKEGLFKWSFTGFKFN